jgi:hypothetical protein
MHGFWFALEDTYGVSEWRLLITKEWLYRCLEVDTANQLDECRDSDLRCRFL